jgi:hypothetical protein
MNTGCSMYDLKSFAYNVAFHMDLYSQDGSRVVTAWYSSVFVLLSFIDTNHCLNASVIFILSCAQLRGMTNLCLQLSNHVCFDCGLSYLNIT